jgi:transposase
MTYVWLKLSCWFIETMHGRRINNIIGIDISKNWVDVFAINLTHASELQFRCKNDEADFIRMETKLSTQNIKLDGYCVVVFENTGIYTRRILRFLRNKTCKVRMEVPTRINKSLGIQRGKNDKIDAKRIAEYAVINLSKLTFPVQIRPELQLLKTLLTNQERTQKTINTLKVYIAELAQFGTPQEAQIVRVINKPAITGLNNAYEKNKAKIDQLANKDQKIKQQLQLLTSIPQIGKITALNLICCTQEFELHTNGNTLACYLGVAPFEYTSGTSIKGKTRVSHLANKKMKALLHLAAVRCIKKNGVFREYFDRKVSEGKNGMLVINAIRNKLVHRIAAVIKRGNPYINEKEFRRQR